MGKSNSNGCIVGLGKLIGGVVGAIISVMVVIALMSGNKTDPIQELESRCSSLSQSYPVETERSSVYENCITSGKAALNSRGINTQSETAAPIANDSKPVNSTTETDNQSPIVEPPATPSEEVTPVENKPAPQTENPQAVETQQSNEAEVTSEPVNQHDK